ncbi:MAG TPA: serine/threonine-protein kinase [Bryobacteraceae bacterium]|jgi:serine/threonine-protein kinase
MTERYEILAELHSGPTCAVYRAKDAMLDREVALKILAADAANDAGLMERFYREARICARLRHPSLVPVYDIGQDNGIPYIVMELLDGPNLRQTIANRSDIPLGEKLRIVEAIADGLAYAHSMGVIHRDIKPSNIVLEKDGHVRILDFGVALTAASPLTIAGTVLGTPQYMSPEQALGKQCDERSDVFSLAVVAFELTTGKHPFAKRTDFSSNGDFGLAQEALAVLQRGMNQEPQLRYGSPREFAIAFRCATQASVPVRPLDETPIPQPKPRRIGGTETILSAVLLNLQRFEEAADNGDLSGAREAMIAMRRAGADDTRYAIALEQSAKRLDELERQEPARRAVNFDATSLFEHTSSASVPLVSSPVFQAQPTVTVATPSTRTIVRPTQEVIPPAPKPRHVRPTRWSSIIIAALALCCVLLGGVYLTMDNWRKTPKPLPFVATAEVVNVEAPLYAEPNAAQPALAIAHHGDVVNILRAPRDSQQQWTAVQWISAGKPTPPVFAHTADLGKWSSTDPSLDEALRQMFLMSPRVAR